MLVTHWIFFGVILVVAVQRLWELRLSKRHEQALQQQGGRVHETTRYTWIQLIHGFWFISMVAEVVLLHRPFYLWLALPALLVFGGGQVLRYLAITALGKYWTVKIVSLPDAPIVQTGIYRYLRHPNYLGVVLEIASLPLLHTAYLTAIIFSVTNTALITSRIRREEEVLDRRRP